MNDIDIVIPWVNVNDPEWYSDFRKYKLSETGDKCDGRFRDCHTLKYVLRSIESNCPWCRKVVLILERPSQIPSWLNIYSNKLKIVYHSDFIPKKYLPTYNSLLIEMFYPNIDELSEHFILINDDMLFTQNMDAIFYFIGDNPVYNISVRPQYNDDFSSWQLNSVKLLSTVFGTPCKPFDTYHMPVQYRKSVCAFTLSKIYKFFDEVFRSSRFRQRYNIIHFIYYYAHILLHQYVESNANRGRFYFFTSSHSEFSLDYPAVCLNESGDITQQDIEYLDNQLNNAFPMKSSFEC